MIQISNYGREKDFRIKEDVYSLFNALEKLADFYKDVLKGEKSLIHLSWINMVMHCIAGVAFFNANKMISDYNNSI